MDTMDQNMPRWSKGCAVICFYFIGHGFTNQADQYLVSTDGVPVNTKTFVNHPAVKSKNAIAIFNCCRVKMNDEQLLKFQKLSPTFCDFDDLAPEKNTRTGERLLSYFAEADHKVYYSPGLNSMTPFAKEFIKELDEKMVQGNSFEFKDVVIHSTKVCGGILEDNALFKAPFKVVHVSE